MEHKARLMIGIILACLGIALVTFFFYETEKPQTALFGGVSLRIEYATSTAMQEKGLGGRISIPGDYGMLFVFPKSDYYGFWMKDMLVSIDIFWLDNKGQVVSISENIATSSYPNVFYPSIPMRYVLETIAGFARAHGIVTGTPLLLKNFPSVSE
jgi:uncharacterized membrane protein (UPF0127 family)